MCAIGARVADSDEVVDAISGLARAFELDLVASVGRRDEALP
jgi:hypothetical protein